MTRATILVLLLGGGLMAQGLPPRPEQIAFKPLAFEVPRTRDFKARLKNGTPVYLAADPEGVPFVRMRVFIRGGSYLEPRGKEGLAALAGMEMRAGGTASLPAEALDERLEVLAGSISTGLGDTSGFASMEFMEKDLKEGLDLFLQVLAHPAFAQDRLQLAKEDLLQGLMARNDKTEAIAEGELPRLLNGEDHFTSALVTGASLKAITREDLVAFHARLLHPENLAISISGKFRKEAMLDLLNRTVGALKPGPAAKVSPKVPGPDFQRRPGIYLMDKDVPQSLVRFALPGLRRTDPDWHAALVMNQILGGSGFTSRLMKKIRSDEGLTYGIGTRLGDGAFWTGNWSGSLQTKNRSVAFALRLILAEIDHLKTQQVSPEELAVIKDSIVQAFPATWGRKSQVVNSFALDNLMGWPEDWWADYREKIQAVTAAEVQRVARKVLDPGRLVILVVGKAAEAEAGDARDHPGLLKDVVPLPLIHLPLRDPLTLKPLS